MVALSNGKVTYFPEIDKYRSVGTQAFHYYIGGNSVAARAERFVIRTRNAYI
jgi:hypothetical protein